MEGASLLGLGSIPIVLRDSERCGRASFQELLLDGLDTPLKTQRVFKSVIRESDVAVRFSHTSQEKLYPLLLRAASKWSAAHSCEHLGTPVVVGDRDHFLHEAYARRGMQKSKDGRIRQTESDSKRAHAWRREHKKRHRDRRF